MQRIKYNNQFNLIRDSINLLPIKILPMLEKVDFVIDYDFNWLGYKGSEKTTDGRLYKDICFYAWSWKTPDKRATIFLNSGCMKLYNNIFDVIAHEVAHAIHEQLGIHNYGWLYENDYEECYIERFACCFVRWLYKDNNKDSWDGNQELQRKIDKRPIEFFNNLFLK